MTTQGVIPLQMSAGGAGTVTAVSVVTANGFAGSVANPTTTPAITMSVTFNGIAKGDGTALSAAVAADFPTLNQNTTGSAGSVAAANLTGSTLAAGVTASSLTSVGTLSSLTVSGTTTLGNGAANYAQITGTATGNSAKITALGSDTSTGLDVQVKGASDFKVLNANGATQFRARAALLGVNWVETNGGATGSAPTITAAGADTNINLLLSGKGTGVASITGTAANVTGTVAVANGGTGAASLTAYAPIFGGTTGTGAVQSGTVGTTGQVLTSNGPGVLPTFQAAGGASGLVCLASQTVTSTVAAVDFTSGIDSTYDEYEIHIQNVVPANAGGDIVFIRTSSNGGVSYDATSGNYSVGQYGVDISANTAVLSSNNATGTIIGITGNQNASNTASQGGISGVVRLITPSQTTANKQINFQMVVATGSSTFLAISGSAARLSTSVVNAIRFSGTNAGIASGLFKLYGVRKAP